jgi:hypothetical protein
MKWLFCLFLLSFFSCSDDHVSPKPVNGRNNKPSLNFKKETANPFVTVDVSPMDISYYPVDYPKLKSSKANIEPPAARVIYSRPQKQGRKIFGALIKYGELWRLGANETTEIEFFKPVIIQNKKINKGRYAIYSIPQEKTWTIVLNRNIYTWGLHPDPSQDIARFEVPVEKAPATVEYFTMAFINNTSGPQLLISWDDIVTRLPIQFQ